MFAESTAAMPSVLGFPQRKPIAHTSYSSTANKLQQWLSS